MNKSWHGLAKSRGPPSHPKRHMPAAALPPSPEGYLLFQLLTARLECQSCDLHGKASKIRMTQGWQAHLSLLETSGEGVCSNLASHHL